MSLLLRCTTLGLLFFSGVYVDGSPTSGYVTLGFHSISLDDPVWNDNLGCYDTFQYMFDQYSTEYGNGATMPITSDMSFTAVYNPS